MFAYVKFCPPDNSLSIVKTCQIAKFKIPFDKTKKYKVACDDNEVKKAVVIYAEDTEEKLQQTIDTQRTKFPPVSQQVSATEESDVDIIKNNRGKETEAGDSSIQSVLQLKLASKEKELMESNGTKSQKRVNKQYLQQSHYPKRVCMRTKQRWNLLQQQSSNHSVSVTKNKNNIEDFSENFNNLENLGSNNESFLSSNKHTNLNLLENEHTEFLGINNLSNIYNMSSESSSDNDSSSSHVNCNAFSTEETDFSSDSDSESTKENDVNCSSNNSFHASCEESNFFNTDHMQDIFEYYLKTNKQLIGSNLLSERDTYEDHIRAKISDLLRPPKNSKPKVPKVPPKPKESSSSSCSSESSAGSEDEKDAEEETQKEEMQQNEEMQQKET